MACKDCRLRQSWMRYACSQIPPTKPISSLWIPVLAMTTGCSAVADTFCCSFLTFSFCFYLCTAGCTRCLGNKSSSGLNLRGEYRTKGGMSCDAAGLVTQRHPAQLNSIFRFPWSKFRSQTKRKTSLLQPIPKLMNPWTNPGYSSVKSCELPTTATEELSTSTRNIRTRSLQNASPRDTDNLGLPITQSLSCMADQQRRVH